VYERVYQTKKLILSLGLQNVVKVFADGGIRENTVPELRASGVDGVVAGSLAFKSNNLDETFRWFHSLETNPRRLTWRSFHLPESGRKVFEVLPVHFFCYVQVFYWQTPACGFTDRICENNRRISQ